MALASRPAAPRVSGEGQQRSLRSDAPRNLTRTSAASRNSAVTFQFLLFSGSAVRLSISSRIPSAISSLILRSRTNRDEVKSP